MSQLEGCQESKRGYKGETQGSQQGERKSQGNCAMYICNCARVCNEMIGRLNDAS
jgi:hypothetical protein